MMDHMLVQKCPKYNLKIKILKKWNQYPQEFKQGTRVSHFRQIWPFVSFLEHPKGFRSI